MKKFVSSGTVAMNPDGSCQLLAEVAIDIDEIDVVVRSLDALFLLNVLLLAYLDKFSDNLQNNCFRW